MVTIPAQKDDKFSDTVIDIMRKIEECIKDIPRWFHAISTLRITYVTVPYNLTKTSKEFSNSGIAHP